MLIDEERLPLLTHDEWSTTPSGENVLNAAKNFGLRIIPVTVPLGIVAQSNQPKHRRVLRSRVMLKDANNANT